MYSNVEVCIDHPEFKLSHVTAHLPQEPASRYTDSQHQINLCLAETQERHLRPGGRDPFGTARDALPPENVQLGQQVI